MILVVLSWANVGNFWRDVKGLGKKVPKVLGVVGVACFDLGQHHRNIKDHYESFIMVRDRTGIYDIKAGCYNTFLFQLIDFDSKTTFRTSLM